MKKLYILAGPNGAGKTTTAQTLLPYELKCREFVNADEIARGLSPFNPENQAMQAGRLMLQRIDRLIAQGEDLAFETTLATKHFASTVAAAQRQGYQVRLIFLYLESVALAKERVARRVREGGHNIPSDVIARRYHRGLSNLFGNYLPIVDEWEIYNHSSVRPSLIANGDKINVKIEQPDLYQKMQSS